MSFGKQNLLILVWVTIFLGWTQPLLAQSKPMKWKLAAGDQFDVTLNQTSLADSRVDSRKTVIENATTLELSWDVLKVAQGDWIIEQAIQGISLSVSNPAVPSQGIELNTSATDVEAKGFSKASKALLKQIKPLIGLKFIVTMAASGKIKEVTLPQQSTDIINKLPDTVRLRRLFSPQGLTEILGASAIVFPDKTIKSGESWSEKEPVTTPLGAFSRNRTYTVVGETSVEGDGVIEIKMEPAMVPQESENKSVESSFESKLISFTGSGKLLVDTKNGFLRSSEFENELKSERPYREKKIITVVKNQIRMTINKAVNEK